MLPGELAAIMTSPSPNFLASGAADALSPCTPLVDAAKHIPASHGCGRSGTFFMNLMLPGELAAFYASPSPNFLTGTSPSACSQNIEGVGGVEALGGMVLMQEMLGFPTQLHTRAMALPAELHF